MTTSANLWIVYTKETDAIKWSQDTKHCIPVWLSLYSHPKTNCWCKGDFPIIHNSSIHSKSSLWFTLYCSQSSEGLSVLTSLDQCLSKVTQFDRLNWHQQLQCQVTELVWFGWCPPRVINSVTLLSDDGSYSMEEAPVLWIGLCLVMDELHLDRFHQTDDQDGLRHPGTKTCQ